ncbi:nitric oxide dioxygenase [Novosphingobium sp. PP1Y]|nr:nitric oxide dioxygenase [Novosphingobium sp. PP1Y]
MFRAFAPGNRQRGTWLPDLLSPLFPPTTTKGLSVRKPLSAETKAIVKSTAPALQQHGLAITTRMYERLFIDPDVKAMFDQAAQESGEQPRRLAGAILAYAQNIDKLEALTAPVMRMAARHVETGVKAEHYPLVANALLPAIRDVLGDAATDEVLGAWGEAYWALADILIGKEEVLYAEVDGN